MDDLVTEGQGLDRVDAILSALPLEAAHRILLHLVGKWGLPVKPLAVPQRNPQRNPQGNSAEDLVGSSVSDSFEQFWSLYPKKKDRQEALKSFRKLAPSKELFDRILQALHEQIAWPEWARDDGKYIPYASRWLNRKRWEDAPDAVPQITASGTASGLSEKGMRTAAAAQRLIKRLGEDQRGAG